MQTAKRQAAGLPVEVVLVWMLFALVTVEVLVTYSRIPPRELYHVSGSGIEGGLSRALVFVNFPVALVALAVLGLIYRRLPGRSYRAVAILAGVLCAAVFWPGIVSQADLDARPVNAVAAIGVLLALVLTGVVASKGGASRSSWQRADWVRVALAVVLLVAALPWLAADLGLYSNGVPLRVGVVDPQEHPVPERAVGDGAEGVTDVQGAGRARCEANSLHLRSSLRAGPTAPTGSPPR